MPYVTYLEVFPFLVFGFVLCWVVGLARSEAEGKAFYDYAAPATSNCGIGRVAFFQVATREIFPVIGDT